MCTTGHPVGRVVHALRAHIDRFEGPAEAGSLVLIFPLFDGGGEPAEAGSRSVNGGRLGPPESAKTVRTSFWEPGLQETRIPISERKRRLLHDFIDEKMRSECTIFPYRKR